jgi:hypothetical protein
MVRGRDTITVWESYAFPIRDIGQALNSIIPIDMKFLIDKIKDDGYRVAQNNVIYQDRKDRNEQSCGRYVVLRLCFAHLDQSKFNNYVKAFTDKYHISPMSLSILLTADMGEDDRGKKI